MAMQHNVSIIAQRFPNPQPGARSYGTIPEHFDAVLCVQSRIPKQGIDGIIDAA